MTLVSLGLRPSLNAAARKLDDRLPVSLAALYDKVNRCEPAVLRGFLGAARPGHTLVVYDPESALVCDIVACEDTHQSERVAAATLIESAPARQAWIADRHFCTEALLRGLSERQACFIVREHARHPRVSERGP